VRNQGYRVLQLFSSGMKLPWQRRQRVRNE
jgi:hypothetical protein